MSGLTLVDAWEAFEEERAVTLAPTSLNTDYAQVRKWLQRCPVTEAAESRRALGWVLRQTPPKAAKRVAMYLKALCRWAASEDVALMERNPVQSYRIASKGATPSEPVVVIPRFERKVLLEALKPRARSARPWHLPVELMLQTGIRTGEAFGLQWQDVEGATLRVQRNMALRHGLRATTKTGRSRSVPLNSRALRLLAQLPQEAPEALVFPWSREAMQSFWRDRVGRLVEEGRLQRRYRPYDLRHTAISSWLEAGIPVAQAAAWAGNSAQVIWRHYAASTQSYEVPEL